MTYAVTLLAAVIADDARDTRDAFAMIAHMVVAAICCGMVDATMRAAYEER